MTIQLQRRTDGRAFSMTIAKANGNAGAGSGAHPLLTEDFDDPASSIERVLSDYDMGWVPAAKGSA